MPNKPTMTSLEAAALYSSNGATDDPHLANQMAAGEILDPDALERAHFRRMLGFDFTVDINEAKNKATIRDDELGLSVTCAWQLDQEVANTKRLAKACIKLKQKHDAAIAVPEGEVVDA